jgi:hypothetical protein
MPRQRTAGRVIGPNPQYQEIVDKIIAILREAHKPEPITKKTVIGDKADVILADINSAFFETGGFTAISSTVTVSGLADQVIAKGGKV